MDPFLPTTELLSALSLGAWTLAAFALGLGFYGYVADRVIFEAGGRVRAERLGPVDALIVLLLTVLFTFSVLGNLHAPEQQSLPSDTQMVEAALLTIVILAVIIGGIFGALSARDIRWREVFGLDRVGPLGVVSRAVLLLACALPLVGGASLLSRLLLAAGGSQDDSAQEMVRFLEAGGSHPARLVVAGSAVFLAPVVEEFIFRGYLYGVVRRYAGVTVGILFNATLFAAIHVHLPSFGGLFVLAVCLTLAYEWSGSIFIPITMHALFNLTSVLALLQGGANGG